MTKSFELQDYCVHLNDCLDEIEWLNCYGCNRYERGIFEMNGDDTSNVIKFPQLTAIEEES